MASDIDICNAALSLIGDTAKVTTINPPDPSTQATLCARFYPMARDALLEMHNWGFATTRATLALLQANPTSSWAYAYAAPANAVNYLEILDPLAADDYSFGITPINPMPGAVMNGPGVVLAEPFVIESINGQETIFTNKAGAVLRYTQLVSNPAEFPPLFTMGLGVLLSSYLAGPIIKGAEGRATAMSQMQAFFKWKEMAVESDANQRRIELQHGPAWIQNR